MDGVNSLCVKKNPFAQRGFTGIDMRADSDVAYVLIVELHFTFLSLKTLILIYHTSRLT
jgi:hypothetical protein